MDPSWKPQVSWNINDPAIKKLLSTDSRPITDNSSSKKPITKPSKAPTQSKDLTTQMAERLRKVEQVNLAQRKELKEKTDKIERLEQELAQLRAAVSPDVAVEFQRVHSDKDRLKLQVQEMERFLLKYGLRWVGDRPEGELDTATLQQDISGSDPRYRFQLPKEIDIRVIERRIQELNIIAEHDAQRLVSNGGVHQFKAPEPVAILFYQNGLILQGFQFRPYSSHEAQSLLSDILEGYFPHDLKRKFPEGVPLRVVDYTEQQFTGESTKLQGVRSAQTGLKSAEEFLADLPESVVRDGKLVPIRAGIEKILKPKPEDPIELGSHSEITGDRVTTLRIKTESGKKTLIVKMSFDDRLSDLKRIIDPQRELRTDCLLVCAFPSRTFNWTDGQSLEQLGLTPNYALMLRAS